MLRVVIILTVISAACCQLNCPGFSGFIHDDNLVNELIGRFYVIHSSLDQPLDCETAMWTVEEGNILTAIVEIPNCCMRITDFNTANSAHIPYTVDPIFGDCLWTYTEDASLKLLGTLNEGEELCLVGAVCDEPRDGIIVACREQNPSSLLGAIFSLLVTLVGTLAAL